MLYTNLLLIPSLVNPILKEMGIHSDNFRNPYPEIITDLEDLKDRGKEEDYLDLVREFGEEDFFFFAFYVLGMPIAHPFLLARCNEIQDNGTNYTLSLWAREHFKMLSVDEPVPVPSGWSKHGDLKVGDEVFGSDGKPTKVVAKTPVYTTGEAYLIEFTDGSKIKAGAKHLWPIEKRTRKRISGTNKRIYRETVIMTTEEIALHEHFPDKRLSLNMGTVLELPEKELLIEPYTLGAWLGDGSSDSNTITCGYEDLDIIKEISSFYPVKEGKSSNNSSGLFYIDSTAKGDQKRGFRVKLKKINVFKNKHIPFEYLRGSSEQRWSLLQGLMDTDGHCNNRGTAGFTNINKRLIDDVFELCCSLGLNPKKHSYTQKVNNEDYVFYIVSFQAHKDFPPFRLKRKIERCKNKKPTRRKFIKSCIPIEPEPMSCIQVENSDGIYLAGKDFFPTHNSSLLTHALPLHEIIHDPNRTIAIFSFERKEAKKHLRVIKSNMEQNWLLRSAWPDIFYKKPIRESIKWNEDDGLYVKRTSRVREASFSAFGLIENQPTGSHFTDMVIDDPVTPDNVATVEQLQKVKDAFKMMDNLGQGNARRRVIGTRYDIADIYGDLIKKDKWKVLLYPAEIDKTGKGVIGGIPVFKTREELDHKLENQETFIYSSQMLQDPTATTNRGFALSWLTYYNELPSNLNKYLLVDPANSKGKRSDYSVFAVIGIDYKGQYYLVDLVRDKLDVGERWNKLKELYLEHEPEEVGYERYSMQSDIDFFKLRMDDENTYIHIIELGGNTESKRTRIEKLRPLFRKKNLLLPRELIYTDSNEEERELIGEFIEEEYSKFPHNKAHDDMLDAMSRILDNKLDVVRPEKKAEVTEIKSDPFFCEYLRPSNTGTSWQSGFLL